MNPSPFTSRQAQPGPRPAAAGGPHPPVRHSLLSTLPREKCPARAGAAGRSGALLIRHDRVCLERGCPDHGLVSTLYDESPEILRYLEKWQAPTKQHIPDQAGNYRLLPEAYAYGLPAM